MRQTWWISMPELDKSIIRVKLILSLDHYHDQTLVIKQDRRKLARHGFHWQPPYPNKEPDDMMMSYQPCRKGMVESATHLLTRSLARENTCRTILHKRESLFLLRYAISNLNILTLSLFWNHNSGHLTWPLESRILETVPTTDLTIIVL